MKTPHGAMENEEDGQSKENEHDESNDSGWEIESCVKINMLLRISFIYAFFYSSGNLIQPIFVCCLLAYLKYASIIGTEQLVLVNRLFFVTSVCFAILN